MLRCGAVAFIFSIYLKPVLYTYCAGAKLNWPGIEMVMKCFNFIFCLAAEDSSLKKDEEEKRRMEIFQTFRTAPSEEIVARSEAKVR